MKLHLFTAAAALGASLLLAPAARAQQVRYSPPAPQPQYAPTQQQPQRPRPPPAAQPARGAQDDGDDHDHHHREHDGVGLTQREGGPGVVQQLEAEQATDEVVPLTLDQLQDIAEDAGRGLAAERAVARGSPADRTGAGGPAAAQRPAFAFSQR